MTYYAHKNEQDESRWQKLKDHLLNTAELARSIGRHAGVGEFAALAAMLHDLGKYSEAFQKKLAGASIRTDHSTAGAQEILRLFQNTSNQKKIATLLAYCIAGHHAGLPDFGSPVSIEDGSLNARLKKKVPDFQAYIREINPTSLALPERLQLKPLKGKEGFSLAFFTRMVYSTLVDADFLETEAFMQGALPRGGYDDLPTLCERLNRYLARFDQPTNAINRQRTATLKSCIEKSGETPGFFTLTIPTGGGKTLASMAFALNHAVKHGLQRIIYVIPYTSIIEQNAAVFKECLGGENVLEHHSNFDWGKESIIEVEAFDDQTNHAVEKLKLAAENWDIPVVVTTNVQFFESLYANRSSRCRKLHNIARSVMIFDEAQMLPRDFLQPCLYAVHELVRNYGSSAVFCTATQPALETLLPAGTTLLELADQPRQLYTFYRRVEVKKAGTLTDTDLLAALNAQKQALCIVNTRRHAKGLYAGLEGEGKFHLSTLMCPAHRKRVIGEIKARLRHGELCRVVSTQIMECGIDVDFPLGYRALAGLDSVIQAAGRVNREGRQTSGDIFVFEPDSEFVKRTPAFIQQGADVARSVLRQYDDPICLEAIAAYYDLLYNLQGANAFDARGILACFAKPSCEPDFDFRTAAEKFHVIEAKTLPVVVPYDEEAKRLLDEVRFGRFPRAGSRKLQMYTTNIYEREFQALQNIGAMDTYGGVYAVLSDMNFYSDETGIVIPESPSGEAIFYDG